MEWYIQGLLPLMRIPLTQQRIATLISSLEQSMKIEAIKGYPWIMRVTRPRVDPNLLQIQGQISTLTKKIQELTLPRP
jgi:hypothetical protein